MLVLYPAGLPTKQLEELRRVVGDADGAVLAGPHANPATSELKVITLKTTMTCPELDTQAVREFSTTWIDSLNTSA